MKPLLLDYQSLILLKGRRRRRRKAKVARRVKLILRTSTITAKNRVIGSETIQRKQRKIMLLLLFRMTPHWKVI